MKNFIMAIILSVSSVGGYAAGYTADSDWSKLTSSQKETIMNIIKVLPEAEAAKVPADIAVEQVAAKAVKPAAVEIPALDQLERIGTNTARGLVSFAKELGVAASDFAKTPLGILVTIGLVMNLGGTMITSLIVGVLFLFILFPITARLAYKSFMPTVTVNEWTTKPVLFGLWQKQYPANQKTLQPFSNGEGDVFKSIVLIITSFLFMLIGSINFVL